MKTALVLLFSFAASSFAADPKPVKAPAENPPQQAEQVKRLSSVTWDLGSEKLVWIVQTGTVVKGEFVPSSEQKYEISPDNAVMAVASEQRGFDGDEAQALHHLLDVLSVYCAESVVWWDEGQGTPVTQPAPTATDPPATNQKPVRVGQPGSNKPKYKVPDSDYVAMVR
jgi:hypothetical protein